jgi:hypothetical protein
MLNFFRRQDGTPTQSLLTKSAGLFLQGHAREG